MFMSTCECTRAIQGAQLLSAHARAALQHVRCSWGSCRDMQSDPVAEAYHGMDSLGPNIQALRSPGWTNPTLLGTIHQYVSEFPECFTSHGVPSEMHQDLPSMPSHSKYKHTQCGPPLLTLGHTVFGDTHCLPATEQPGADCWG